MISDTQVLANAGALEVGTDDIKDIERRGRIRRLVGKALLPVAPVVSFVVGFLAGIEQTAVESAYPYYAGSLVSVGTASTRGTHSVAVTLLLVPVGLVLGYLLGDLSNPTYGISAKYSVFDTGPGSRAR